MMKYKIPNSNTYSTNRDFLRSLYYIFKRNTFPTSRKTGTNSGWASCTKWKSLLLLTFIIMPIGINAQPSGYAGSFTRIGFGPRGMAMGNALTAGSHEGVYAYYNPASAAYTLPGNQLDISTSLMSFDRSLHVLNSTFRLPPSAGFNVAILNANVANIDGRTPGGYYTGDLETHEYQLMTAFGLSLHEKVAVGFGVKLNLADYHKELSNASSVGFDVGLIVKVNKKLDLGLAVRDLLSNYSWNTGELYGDETLGKSNEAFPVRLDAGLSYSLIPDFFLAMNYGRLIHSSRNFQQLKVGAAWKAHDRISLRGGWQIDDLNIISKANRPSAGFSLHLPFDRLNPSIDYAFLLEPNQISTMHVFGIKMKL